jgi:hypothetical protein
MPGLVERETLLAQLMEAQREGGQLLLVGGEAGVGKTALVRAFASGLDVLRVVGRRIGATPSLMLVTYRDDEAIGDHPLRRMLGDLASAAAVERVEVPPLSVEAVRKLASGHDAGGSCSRAAPSITTSRRSCASSTPARAARPRRRRAGSGCSKMGDPPAEDR